MKELLNKLIERGWKPFRESYINEYDFEFRDNGHTLVSCHSNEDDEYTNFDTYSWRDIASKESGLWQFCCESKLIEQGKTVHDFVMKHICYADENRCGGFSMCNAEYYIMMCSLLDESELEQFLIDNIKI